MKFKDNKFYKKYLEYKSNPQTKDVISLCFWLLFFFAVVVFARLSSRPVSNNSDNFVNELVNNYEYSYIDDKTIIYGKTFNGNHVFNVLNGRYYYDGEDVYEIKDHSASIVKNDFINYLKITPQMINSLTENLNYSVFENALVYKVPLSNFMNLFDNDVPLNLEEASKYDIIINKYYLDDVLYMVKIDLSNYYRYYNQEDRGLLTIELFEQNKISDFSNEYEKIVGVIK